MPPVQRRPLATQVAEALLERVRAAEWPIGHKLPSEAALAAQLGVGRSTLREAVRELAAKGVLDSRQGAGVFVTALEAGEDRDAVLRRASVLAVIEARVAIEAEAAALAAERRTPAELRAIRRALDGRAFRDQPLEEYVDADTAFHRTVIVAAHNDVLVDLFDSFIPRIRKAMVDMLRVRPPGTSHDTDHAAHADLVTAIADREAAAAAAHSRAHLTTLKRAFS
ncbi:FCD domain-containing protein [Amycolatopsis sp. OK19-0408]|uniref:FCD domain-containing protein n=1 Tax=Amycolatopsis iheyensis TaxID=2945988 RepID=A0A9X2N7T5_9PSEU|nr:FCD domain-containing protein [Amycolatopsis iheyensis]MCR6482832.1 FCD domain-containing protein [Amycolatopsis iheyensis]